MLQHIDRVVPVTLHHPNLNMARRALMSSGLLRGAEQGDRPRHTMLTYNGRYAACLLLGDYADALEAAGFFEMIDPALRQEALARIKRAMPDKAPPAVPTGKNFLEFKA